MQTLSRENSSISNHSFDRRQLILHSFTCELYAVTWKRIPLASCEQEILTGTKSSLTCVHLTVPELEVVTWKTSAQSLTKKNRK